MHNFKIRCSAIGRIMTDPKTKAAKEAGELSETAKTYAQEWLKEQLYGVRKQIWSKEIQKGIQCEDGSIAVYGAAIDVPFIVKNEDNYANAYLTGTPDLILPDRIVDIKTSWDVFTFPLFDTEIPNKDYWWQLQGYMALTGKDLAELVYVLVNTPDELCYNDTDRTDYENLPIELRVKRFTVLRDDDAIQAICTRVGQVRAYLGQIWKG